MNYFRNIRISFAAPIIIGSLTFFITFQTCKEFEPSGFLHISTDTITIGSQSPGIYELTGSVVNMGDEDISQHGFCWAEWQMPETSASSTKLGERNSTGSFSSSIDGLKPLTTYYVRAYATTSRGTFYGEEKSFLSAEPSIPTVTTSSIININANSAECGGEVTDEGPVSVTSRGVCWSTNQEPTIADRHTTDGEGSGSFTSMITGLEVNMIYYVRAYATSSEGTAYGKEVFFKTWDEGDFTDYDGNVYSTIVIGEQTWMKENLRVTHYADGTPIPVVAADWEWEELTKTSKAYCWYNNDMENADPYGALYTWPAVMNGSASSDQNPSHVQGVCPDGWHLPSDAEWMELEIYLGMDPAEADTSGIVNRGEEVGGKLKEEGIAHWMSPNTGATNLSGFTAVPGGARSPDGRFVNLGHSTGFFSATEFNYSNVWHRGLVHNNSYISRGKVAKDVTASVRCVQGQAISRPSVITDTVIDITETTAISTGAVTNGGSSPVTARGVCWSTSPDPTLSDNSVEGIGEETFTCSLSGLSPFTTYYLRAYASNNVGTAYGREIVFKTFWDNAEKATDFEGNSYRTIQIGDQVWLQESLKSKYYSDGTAIQLVEDKASWDALGEEEKGYSWYEYNSSNSDSYGALYTWTAATNGKGSSEAVPSGVQGVCPSGWHLPSDAEWKQLEIYLGMSLEEADGEVWRGTDEGGRMKDYISGLWDLPNIGATNESGFSALPGGYIQIRGNSVYLGSYSVFWTATEYSSTEGWHRNLLSDYDQVYRYFYSKKGGLSIRCVVDE